jgi:hypothetical protein
MRCRFGQRERGGECAGGEEPCSAAEGGLGLRDRGALNRDLRVET